MKMASHDLGKPNSEKQDAQLTEAEKKAKANVTGQASPESLEAAVQPEVTTDAIGSPTAPGQW
jgi:hypothetical protein